MSNPRMKIKKNQSSRLQRSQSFAKKASERVPNREILYFQDELSQFDDTCQMESDNASFAFSTHASVKSLSKHVSSAPGRIEKGQAREILRDVGENLKMNVAVTSKKIFKRNKGRPAAFLTWDCFHLTKSDLRTRVMIILEDLDLTPRLTGKPLNDYKNALKSFITEVLGGYEENPYHNAHHGFQVFQMASIFFTLNSRLRKSLQRSHTMAFLMAALAHDIKHPGSGNSVEAAFATNLAKETKNIAILENYHASTTLEILDEKRCDIFFDKERGQRMALRKFIAKLIISTDSSFSKMHLKNLNTVDNLDKYLKEGELNVGSNKMRLCNALMHTFDVSAQCVDIDVAVRWERRMAVEFKNEYELLVDNKKTPPKHLETFGERNREESLMWLFEGTEEAEKMQERFGYFEKDKDVVALESLEDDSDSESETEEADEKEKPMDELETIKTLERKCYAHLPTRKEAANQVFFIQELVSPLWKPIVMFSPQMRHFYGQLTMNKKYYDFLSKGDKEAARKHFRTRSKNNVLDKIYYENVEPEEDTPSL